MVARLLRAGTWSRRFLSVVAVIAVAAATFVGVTAAPSVASAEPVSAAGPAASSSTDSTPSRSGGSATSTAEAAAATSLSGSSFSRAYIISDYLFYQSDAMTQAQIQSFLDSKCPTHNCIDNIKTTSASRAATNMCPNAYAGATSETTAAIIYKVQRSCGISAKAILVILQKEEGLVTYQNPSAGRLKIAMGYGCPDTAACASQYFGLFNQIYDASSQMKRYGLRTSDNVSFRNKYQIGVLTAVRYSPNAACGTVNVRVGDKATTALYYYTPYTPNAAALANLLGTGDSCSSYGNRNFWVYWNKWFGSTLIGLGQDMINDLYTQLGSAAGELGAAVGTSTCAPTSTACSQAYASGLISWTKATGPIEVVGNAYTAYQAAGGLTGPLGAPTGSYVSVSNANATGGGQQFVGGTIYSSTLGTFAVTGAIKAEYKLLGSNAAAIGWPTGAQTCVGAICSQSFQGGVIVAVSKTVARPVLGSYGTAYLAAGGAGGPLGDPLAAQVVVTNKAHGNGGGQQFSGGTLYSSSAGVFAVTGYLKTEYALEGSNQGVLGWPTDDQSCAGAICQQDYQGGTLVTTSATSALPVLGAIAAYYRSAGGALGSLGAPTAAATSVAAASHGSGTSQVFSGGVIYAATGGTFAVTGAIKTQYITARGPQGGLGWPIADASCAGTDCLQHFQGGDLNSAGTIPPPRVIGSGAGQVAITAELGKQGGTAGVLGAAGDSTCVSASTICAETFAHGVIGWSKSYGAFTIDGTMLAAYLAAGSITGRLGAPTGEYVTVTTANGAGGGQQFVGGTIYTSTAGAFAVTAAIKAEYKRKGSNAGVLGWPTADQACTGAVCSQAFHGGAIVSSSATVAMSLIGPYAAAYSAAGGPTGPLGHPVGEQVVVVNSTHGNGGGQQFSGGTLYSSAAGIFAVAGKIKTVYSSLGSNRGFLGWPIASQVCTGNICTQKFQGGHITE